MVDYYEGGISVSHYYDDDRFWHRERRDGRYAMLGLQQPKKGKFSHPYSYDPFIVWCGNVRKGDQAVYDDRLFQWDSAKFERCAKEVSAKYPNWHFRQGNPQPVEEFLSLYYDKPVQLTAIVVGCNVSNGYPYWIFYFRDKEEN